jgi:hypothetical protein
VSEHLPKFLVEGSGISQALSGRLHLYFSFGFSKDGHSRLGSDYLASLAQTFRVNAKRILPGIGVPESLGPTCSNRSHICQDLRAQHMRLKPIQALSL